jgi:hypothetical protein
MPPRSDRLESFAAAFDRSSDFTLGIEEEFQLLDPDTLELTHRFEELRAALEPRIGSYARGELIASEIEVCTSRCDDMEQAVADLMQKRVALYEEARRLGITIGASGTHPFADWKDQKILDTPHYRQVEERLRYCAWRNTTFGTHTHVGIRGHERVIAVYNAAAICRTCWRCPPTLPSPRSGIPTCTLRGPSFLPNSSPAAISRGLSAAGMNTLTTSIPCSPAAPSMR